MWGDYVHHGVHCGLQQDGLSSIKLHGFQRERQEANREYPLKHGVPRNPVEPKRCPSCGETKDRSNFFTAIGKADGLGGRWKNCMTVRHTTRHEANPGTMNAHSHHYRARKLDADCGCANAEAIALVVKAYGSACVYCLGAYGHIDHVVPLAGGGRH